MFGRKKKEKSIKEKRKGGFAFGIVIVAAVAELILFILHLLQVNFAASGIIEAVVFSLMVIVVALRGRYYLKSQKFIWKLLYFFIVVALLACIIVPRVVEF